MGSVTKNAFRRASHVIFDLDGLILDTEIIYKNAIAAIAQKHGKIYTDAVRAKVIGRVEREGARVAIQEMNLPMDINNFIKQFTQTAHQYFQKQSVSFLPGAEQLIRHLHRSQVPIAVATSSSLDSYNLKVQNHQSLFTLFSHVVTGGSDPEVHQGKPAPDIFLVCASRFNDKPQPADCLVFEDAPNGVTAAVTAGMQVIAVPDPQLSPDECKHATLRVKSLEDVQLEQFGLPPIKV